MADKRITLTIEGMHCGSCANRAQAALRNLPGVVSANVNLAAREALVEFNPERLSASDLLEAVKCAGYTASEKSAEERNA